MKEAKDIGIGLMARAPEIGKVKTRLATTLGHKRATAVYCDLLKHIAIDFKKEVEQLPQAPVAFYWFVEPDVLLPRVMEDYPGFDGYMPQTAGDLGQRMKRALTTLLERHQHAALIGADIPDISANHIAQTRSALKSHDVVFGPTHDGGYYLIGVNQPHRALFENIPWSSSDTLEQSLAACEKAQLRYHLLEPLSDLDTFRDFQRIIWRPSSVQIEPLE